MRDSLAFAELKLKIFKGQERSADETNNDYDNKWLFSFLNQSDRGC